MFVALDMFGTLADTSSVVDDLASHCGDRALDVAMWWRQRQLEYMFRVTAMGQFPTFAELTMWGLVSALNEARVEVPDQGQLTDLVAAYRRLRPFTDVTSSLAGLRSQGHTIAVFSVGPRSWLRELVAGYEHLVDDFVVAEDAGVYKPHPAIYRHLLARSGVESSSTVVISSNPFDIIGAGAVGLRTVWCQRDSLERFDPWGRPPDHTVPSLTWLTEVLGSP